jgi:hypothetical protein
MPHWRCYYICFFTGFIYCFWINIDLQWLRLVFRQSGRNLPTTQQNRSATMAPEMGLLADWPGSSVIWLIVPQPSWGSGDVPDVLWWRLSARTASYKSWTAWSACTVWWTETDLPLSTVWWVGIDIPANTDKPLLSLCNVMDGQCFVDDGQRCK